ncbi:MAG: MBL fold metallo-hydrolase [Candidatus Limivivens sp.]|nr:MBL fold metallo-hydrolase [Candidatus Limivivens sp.]
MVNFRAEKLSKRVTRIYGVCTELMYLVEGEEKAALLDTGSGFGSLKAAVEKLTDKPLLVLLTHGHTDHAMGAGEFEMVYMNHRDDYIYVPHGEEPFRREGMHMAEPGVLLEDSDYIPTVSQEVFRDLKGGDSFDLGGVTIKIYDCAGHTKGSVVMLIPEERMLLLGDACNSFTFLYDDYSLTVTEYEENLKKLKADTEGTYDRVLASHGDGELPPDIIDSVIEVCEDIKAGRAEEIPFEFRGTHGLIAKAMKGPGQGRLDGGSGNIVYSRDRI